MVLINSEVSQKLHMTDHLTGKISLHSVHYDIIHVKASTGFSSEVDKMLIHASKAKSCPERNKCVMVLLDEMHIQVFDKHSRKMIGLGVQNQESFSLVLAKYTSFGQFLCYRPSASQTLSQQSRTY